MQSVAFTLRGVPEVDESKCILCLACRDSCPVDAITVERVNGKARLMINYARCIRCLVCAERCPVGAIKVTQRHTVVADSKSELTYSIEKKLTTCEKCGTTTGSVDYVNYVMEKLRELQVEFKLVRQCGKCRVRSIHEVFL